uniref:Uncharacterized protein n=1 Tax=Pipistrellus kuhlii TaxID=59472 RepID=A0A7J7V0W2_PIPKU|nr:hypothetical protein mPipKuh1_008645 [Pipistrellus kuhlii]
MPGASKSLVRIIFSIWISQGKKYIYHLRNFKVKKKASKQGTRPQSSRFGSKPPAFFSSQGDQMKSILAGRPQKFHRCLPRPGTEVSSNERFPGTSDVSACDLSIHNLEKMGRNLKAETLYLRRDKSSK